MKRKLAHITWHDACFRETGWHSEGDVDPSHIMETESAGFLVKEDEKGIVLAVDYDNSESKWRGLTFIPKGMIKRKRVFSL